MTRTLGDLFTPQRRMVGRHGCKGREPAEELKRDPARDLGIKTVAFCISFTGLLDTPHGKLKEVVIS